MNPRHAELLQIQSASSWQTHAAHLLEPFLADTLNAVEGDVVGLSGILPNAQPLRPLSVCPAFLPASLSMTGQALFHATLLFTPRSGTPPVQGHGIEVACLKPSIGST